MDRTSEWAERWGMKFGIKEYKVTTFIGDMMELKKLAFALGGATVPIGDSYRYLNMHIDLDF